jgi:hypothetical protein
MVAEISRLTKADGLTWKPGAEGYVSDYNDLKLQLTWNGLIVKNSNGCLRYGYKRMDDSDPIYGLYNHVNNAWIKKQENQMFDMLTTPGSAADGSPSITITRKAFEDAVEETLELDEIGRERLWSALEGRA